MTRSFPFSLLNTSRPTSTTITITIPTRSMSPPTAKSVAVIGAGAAGLSAAVSLRREGHKVVVFEREHQVGGTWVYTNATEPDPLGLNPSRPVVHSSVYASLRTNLPREVMGFRDYPFLAKDGDNRDPRRFPGHWEVLEYLKDYAGEFGLGEVIRFGSEVKWVGLGEGGKWKVRFGKRGGGDDELDEVYDAVVVCNGHYTEPRIADIPGIDAWPGKQIHSHNYRIPDPFRDQVVVLIGSAASAVDISRDVASVAKEVHIASRSNPNGKQTRLPSYGNIWLHSMIGKACEDGTILFQDGSAVRADIILHCTGYKYHFPFLETKGAVAVNDNRVGPLYKHIFPPLLAPSLSFVGLPWKVVPFPQFEFQTNWIAGILSGRLPLPSPEKMMEDTEAFYKSLESSGIPTRYTHNMSNSQFEYNDWLAAQSECLPTEKWRKQMYAYASGNKTTRPETYRDEWEDENLILEANEDFKKIRSVQISH